MTEKTIVEFPNAPSILALIGACAIIFVDALLLTVAVVILPHMSYPNFMPPRGYTGSPGNIVSGFVSAIAIFGLVCGIMVLLSSVALRLKPEQRQTWGILMLVFSVLSFFGTGGLIVGAVLGIVGAVLTLRWKPMPLPTPPR